MTAAESQELGRLAGILEGQATILEHQQDTLDTILDKVGKMPNSERIDRLEKRIQTLEDGRGKLNNWAVATLTALLVSGTLLVAHVLFGVG